MTTLRDRIQLILDRMQITQRELARRAGLSSETHLNQLLSGRSNDLRGTTLAALVKATGVNSHWLLTGDGSPDLMVVAEVARMPFETRAAPSSTESSDAERLVRETAEKDSTIPDSKRSTKSSQKRAK